MATNDSATATTRAVVTRFYERLALRDPDRISELLAEDVDWYIPGDEALAPWLGRRHHRHEVAAFFRQLLANIDSVRFELQHLLVEGDFAVTTGEFASRMRKTGRVYESLFSTHFTVREGLIVRYRLLEDSHGLVMALTESDLTAKTSRADRGRSEGHLRSDEDAKGVLGYTGKVSDGARDEVVPGIEEIADVEPQ
ncbi:ketosteroid isomerase [Vitiosangium sp. GDMCC 1.1324]|nr:ketosteroid isomerase [Vitiosangium sp. GDMCC 1.1324]